MQDRAPEVLPLGAASGTAGDGAYEQVRERVQALISAARDLSDTCADLADALRPVPGAPDEATLGFGRLRAERTAALLDEAASAARGTLGLLHSAYGALERSVVLTDPLVPPAPRGPSTWPDAFVELPPRTFGEEEADPGRWADLAAGDEDPDGRAEDVPRSGVQDGTGLGRHGADEQDDEAGDVERRGAALAGWVTVDPDDEAGDVERRGAALAGWVTVDPDDEAGDVERRGAALAGWVTVDPDDEDAPERPILPADELPRAVAATRSGPPVVTLPVDPHGADGQGWHGDTVSPEPRSLSLVPPMLDPEPGGEPRPAVYARDPVPSGDAPLGESAEGGTAGRSAVGPDMDQVAADRTTADRTTADRTTADRTTADRTTADRTTADRTTADRTTADRTTADRDAGQAASDLDTADRVAAEQVVATGDAPGRAAGDPDTSDRDRPEGRTLDRDITERDTTERDTTERDSTGRDTTERAAADRDAGPAGSEPEAGQDTAERAGSGWGAAQETADPGADRVTAERALSSWATRDAETGEAAPHGGTRPDTAEDALSGWGAAREEAHPGADRVTVERAISDWATAEWATGDWGTAGRVTAEREMPADAVIERDMAEWTAADPDRADPAYRDEGIMPAPPTADPWTVEPARPLWTAEVAPGASADGGGLPVYPLDGDADVPLGQAVDVTLGPPADEPFGPAAVTLGPPDERFHPTATDPYALDRTPLDAGALDDPGAAVIARQVEAARRHLQAALVVANQPAAAPRLGALLTAVERVLTAVTDLARETRGVLETGLAERTFPGEARFLCTSPWEQVELVGRDAYADDVASPASLAKLLRAIGYEANSVTSAGGVTGVQVRSERYAAHIALVEPAGGGRQRWSGALEWVDSAGASRTWAETLGPVELEDEELARRVDELLRRCVGPLR